MTNNAEITCVQKLIRNDPYDRITHVGGNDGGSWSLTLGDAIEKIERGEWNFFVGRQGRDSVWVEIAVSRAGRKYLKTSADRDVPITLLHLPTCARGKT